MEPISQFDELYVISDLHMGGEAGFQIFDQGARLAATINALAKRPAAKRVGLLINGDLVDFLAEPGATYFDPLGAVRKLARIVGDDAFAPVWKALQQFVQKPQRQLIVTMGNHDLELTLPWVRESLLQILSDGDEKTRGRITLQMDGSGYRCRVGAASVYCVHGNDVDPWNLADYEQLRRIGRDLSQGRTVEPWIANAGTQLVIDVMNDIKKKYPFVDLLKPENEAVIPVLYALDRSQVKKLDQVLGVVKRLTWDKIKRSLNLLSADQESDDDHSAAMPPPGAMLGEVLQRGARANPATAASRNRHEEVERLLRNAHGAMQQRLGAPATAKPQDEFLGFFSSAYSWITGGSTSEVLRNFLDGLKKDQSFQLKHADETYERTDEIVHPNVDFVITGHTHQERALRRKQGGGFYYNSGTWVRLIQLSDNVLNSEAQFEKVFAAFEQGTMAALDKFKPSLVRRLPAVVSIVDEGSAVRAALQRVGGDDPDSPTLETVPGSEYKR